MVVRKDASHGDRALTGEYAPSLDGKPQQKLRFNFHFDDSEQEARFSEFFGLHYRSTALLLTILLACIWIIRAYHYYVETEAVTGFCLLLLAASSVLLQAHNIWFILQDPLSWCSEALRGYIFVADLAACTAAVILTGFFNPAPLTSAFVVHTVHGWCTPFAGVRLSADCLLHALNFECFLIMTFCQWLHDRQMHVSSFAFDCTKLLVFNMVLPMMVNMGSEARLRIDFSKEHSTDVGPLWLSVLSVHNQARFGFSSAWRAGLKLLQTSSAPHSSQD